MFKLILFKRKGLLFILSSFVLISFFLTSVTNLYADQFFSKLDIDEISLKGHKLHIRGDTDLPPGSTLQIKLSIPKLDDDKGKDHDVKAQITPGKFFVMIDLPKEWKNGGWIKFLSLKAIFDPDDQPKKVREIVGNKGEKLNGPKVKVQKNKKILVSVKNVAF